MASLQVSGKQLLLANYGPTVVRAAAVLPATATTAYFTIVTGNVLITSIVGQVTTVMSGTATNLKLNVLSTATTGNADICANVAVTSLAVGSFFTIPSIGSGNAATVGVAPVQNNEFVVGPGSIRAITDATNTGAMKWYLNYIPLDPGAYVAAA
jgi:hypothetical protein